MLRFAIIFLLLTSCAGPRDPRNFHGIDPAFSEHIQLFESLYGNSIGDVSIAFEELGNGVAGICRRWSTGHREIGIDRAYWEGETNESRMGILFHELGHCVLNRDHSTELRYFRGTRIMGHVPMSLMYPYNFYGYYYAELESHYFYELFNPGKQLSTLETKAVPDFEEIECDGH